MLCCTSSVCLAKHLSVVNVRWVSFNDEKASVMLSGEVKKTQVNTMSHCACVVSEHQPELSEGDRREVSEQHTVEVSEEHAVEVTQYVPAH